MKQIVWLACEYGRYGYRRITALLHWEGWRVNHKRVERIWREEGLKVPKKQPKRKRLGLQRARAFGDVRIVAIMYGAFAYWPTVPPTEGLFEC